MPTLTGLLLGNDPNLMIRDLLPFLFFVLPLFTYGLMRGMTLRLHDLLIYTIICLGLVFSLRGHFALEAQQTSAVPIDALYLVNAPSVLFAALFLSLTALNIVSLRPVSWFWSLILLTLAALPVFAMAEVLQRASIIALCVSAAFILMLKLRQSLLNSALIVLMLSSIFFIFYHEASGLIHALLEKNRQVGHNMRLDELQAVWDTIHLSSSSILFGLGWGGTVNSPAVGGLSVNFTHSLLSAMLLKGGIIGLCLISFYLISLSKRLLHILKLDPVLGLALFWPFIINIFFYASYKSLDFALILLLIACYGRATDHTLQGYFDPAANQRHAVR